MHDLFWIVRDTNTNLDDSTSLYVRRYTSNLTYLMTCSVSRRQGGVLNSQSLFSETSLKFRSCDFNPEILKLREKINFDVRLCCISSCESSILFQVTSLCPIFGSGRDCNVIPRKSDVWPQIMCI